LPRRVEEENTLPGVGAPRGTDMRRRAEAVQAETLRVARETQRSKADQPGTEKRRCRDVVVALRRCVTELLVGNDVLGVAAVAVEAGELREVAEVLSTRAA